jgi:hypothetical protein
LSASDFVYISRDHSIAIPDLANDASQIKTIFRVGHLLKKIFGKTKTYECDRFQIAKLETPRYAEAKEKIVTMRNYVIRRLSI